MSSGAGRAAADQATKKVAGANSKTAEALKTAASADATAASLLQQAQEIAASVRADC